MTPKRNGPRQQPPLMRRVVRQIANVGQHPRRPARDLPSAVGEHHALAAALDELEAERLLELLHLHGQGRLRHGALLGRPAEMPGAGHGVEILELLEGDHGDQRILIDKASYYDWT